MIHINDRKIAILHSYIERNAKKIVTLFLMNKKYVERIEKLRRIKHGKHIRKSIRQ